MSSDMPCNDVQVLEGRVMLSGTHPLQANAKLAGTPKQPKHVVVVIMENHDQNQIVGSPNAPYINGTLVKKGLSFSNGHGTDHDSQPNYLELFSGANPGPQGINSPLAVQYPAGVDPTTDAAAAARENASDDNITNAPFTDPNLGAELIQKGKTFAGYSETQPAAGSLDFTFPSTTNPDPATGSTSRLYVRKHNPWVDWQAASDGAIGTNQLPSTVNQPFTAFPTKFAKLPTVSFVVPNEINDMHDTVSATGGKQVGSTGVDAKGNPATDATTIQNGDTWLKTHIDAYRKWATAHDSLLITVWDENDFNFSRANNIAMIVDGSPSLVKRGTNTNYVNHFNTLRTIEDEFGLGHAGLSADAQPFTTNGAGVLVPSA